MTQNIGLTLWRERRRDRARRLNGCNRIRITGPGATSETIAMVRREILSAAPTIAVAASKQRKPRKPK